MEDVREALLLAVGGREAFERGFHARSHYPAETADRALSEAVNLWRTGTDAIVRAGGSEDLCREWQVRFVRLWLEYQRAGARVMNWFVTGPANFPVKRNEKRMEMQRRRGDAFLAHACGATDWIRRRQRSAERAALSAEAANVEHAETPFTGGRMVRNTTLDRVQIVFDGRPDPETIKELKSRAFRWSPREGAWQRQLTRNGVWAAEAIVKSCGGALSSAQGCQQ